VNSLACSATEFGSRDAALRVPVEGGMLSASKKSARSSP
jgi:hypothetical protein